MKQETPNKTNQTAAPPNQGRAAPACPALASVLPVRDQCSGTSVNSHEGFISQREVARRLNKSIRTILNWRRTGIIPYIKCGRSALFKWTDIQKHLETNFRVCAQPPQQSLPQGAPPIQAVVG